MAIILISIVVIIIIIVIAAFYWKSKSADKQVKKDEVPQTKPVEREKIFSRSFSTSMDCCGGYGGKPSSLVCPEGTYVTELYGRSGDLIDNIGVKCSNGNIVGYGGGRGGAPFSFADPNGFNKLVVKSGDLVDNISFYSNNKLLGSRGGGGGSGPHVLDCKDGKIAGLNIRSGALLDRIQVVCGNYQ